MNYATIEDMIRSQERRTSEYQYLISMIVSVNRLHEQLALLPELSSEAKLLIMLVATVDHYQAQLNKVVKQLEATPAPFVIHK